MNITIVQTFTDGFTTYQSGQELSVPSEVAQRWIADGKAQADTDGQQSWLSSTEVAATRALVSAAGISIDNGEALRLWRRKRARAAAVGAGRPAVVAMVGDSIVFGIQGNASTTETTLPATDGTYPGDTDWCKFAERIANARLGKVCPDSWAANDARVTAVGGAAVSSVGLNGRSRSITNTGQTLTFPNSTCKRFEIGYFETTSASSDTATGNFTYNVDASGAVAVNTASAFRTGKIATTPALSAGSHSLVLAGANAAPVYITHAIGYTDGGIAVLRFGRTGWTLGDSLGLQANNSSSVAGQGRLLAGYAQAGWHDMLLIEFAHNDPTQYDTATYSAYLDSIIAACPTTMPIGLIAPPYPPAGQESSTFGVRTDYWDVMRSKAVAGSNVFHARSAEVFGTAAEGLADSLYSGAGSVHPSSAGYGALGQWLADILTA